MIGVVLWSDLNDQKAVFWCEDHGDLAYYSAPSTPDRESLSLTAGDMVAFTITVERKIRRAHNPRIVEQSVCNGLQEELRKSVAQELVGTTNAPIAAEVFRLYANSTQPIEPRKARSG